MSIKQLVSIVSLLILSLVILFVDNQISGKTVDDVSSQQPVAGYPDQAIDPVDQPNPITNNPPANENPITEIETPIETFKPDFVVNSYYQQLLSDSEYNFLTVQTKRIPVQIKQINMNYSKGVTIKPKYLVIHETNNYRAGADANAHYRYWSTNSTANASTHFVVDNNEIYQMLKLNQAAWHVGDNKGYSDITNFNSIGIEIAVNSDGDYMQARQNTIQLTINLMKELDMDISQLKRHYDASGKWCPQNMLDEPELWTDFVQQVEKGLNA